MHKYQKILVGVDGSPQAHAALDRAIELAKQNDAALIIASVLNSDKYVGLGMALGANYINKAAEVDLLGRLQDSGSVLVNQAKSAGITDVTLEITEGNSKTALAEDLVTKYAADLVVIGATGTNVVERVLIGSNAHFIVQHAKVDVLVVR
ncbi:universal stress protein [Periweissella ghanensis]|uniref:Universal stress protein n=1 Tax=Periweissella ghanensis TaxID=467997 RepID=A0ABN8BT96_9LACO|nr:universal stress protein [Periweissella ghanensis]MCM0601421.1 universal stress protein [Periweissella ghanensis]CAH0419482.1 Putative universal stress protein [Periweissella ghanensis]